VYGRPSNVLNKQFNNGGIGVLRAEGNEHDREVVSGRRYAAVVLWVVAAGVAGAAVAVAGADTKTYQVNPTEVTNEDGLRHCSATRATTRHGRWEKGKTKGHVYSSIGSSCGFPRYMDAGKLKLKVQWMKRSNSGWGVCWSPGWIKSNTEEWEFKVSATFGRRICGGGYYETWATGGVRINGEWRGVNVIVRSGRHWF
jgi:hypothetical protein